MRNLWLYIFFLLEIKFGSKVGVAPVDDQTEQQFLVSGKRHFAFL